MSLRSLLYPAVQYGLRLTTRRDVLAEARAQRQFRRRPPREQIDHAFRRAVEHANRMRRACPPYGDLLDRAGIPDPIPCDAEVWKSLPTLRKDNFRADPQAWRTTLNAPDTLLWTCTSGSTGEPFEFPLSADCVRAENVGNELNLKAVGWNPGWVSATIKVELKELTGKRRLMRKLMGNEPVGIAAFELTPERVPATVEKLAESGARFLRGYASTVYLLADEMLRRGLRLRIPLIETIGEELTAKRAEVIEQAFGGKVYRDYGGSEAMHIGWECRARNGFHLHLSRFLIEILDGDRPVNPGETGDVVLTDYRNDALPLIRYRIGDRAVLGDPDAECTCGNRSPRLMEILGRVSDIVYTPEKKPINLHVFTYVFEYAHEHVRRFRVIQKAYDHLHILWVAGHENAEAQLPALERQIHEQTGEGMRVTWEKVTDIPPEKSGKRRILVPLGETA